MRREQHTRQQRRRQKVERIQDGIADVEQVKDAAQNQHAAQHHRQHCQQAGIEDGKAQLLFLQKAACQHQHRQYCQRSIKDGGQGAGGQEAGLCIKAGDR